MSNRVHAALVAAFIVGAILGWVSAPYSWDGSGWSVVIPSCAEDQAIVGTGSFEHGQWSAYECGPAADDH
jgi:hypothetical protein